MKEGGAAARFRKGRNLEVGGKVSAVLQTDSTIGHCLAEDNIVLQMG